MTPSYTPGPGLCGVCSHVRVVRNRRGSTFFLCGLSETDARFPRYPPLPVFQCPGFTAANSPHDGKGSGEATG